MKQTLLNKIEEREILKNCCTQKWASEAQIKHWNKGIVEYDKEITQLCLVLGESEYIMKLDKKDIEEIKKSLDHKDWEKLHCTCGRNGDISCDESVVIMSAVRYMLGRGSYGVGCVCDWVIVNKNRLTKSNKQVIERDIEEYLDKHPDTRYKQDWLNVIKVISEN